MKKRKKGLSGKRDEEAKKAEKPARCGKRKFGLDTVWRGVVKWRKEGSAGEEEDTIAADSADCSDT